MDDDEDDEDFDVCLYFPFSNWDEDQAVRNTKRFFKGMGWRFKTAIHDETEKPLDDVSDLDLLLVTGHGSPHKNELSIVSLNDGVTWKLTATDLAEQLEADGLSDTHESILLVSCFGGGVSKFRKTPAGKGLPLAPSGLETGFAASECELKGTCFAGTLAAALGLRGYRDIMVGGWPGELVLGDAHANPMFKAFTGIADNQELVVGHLDHIQWFGWRGTPLGAIGRPT